MLILFSVNIVEKSDRLSMCDNVFTSNAHDLDDKKNSNIEHSLENNRLKSKFIKVNFVGKLVQKKEAEKK